MDIKKRNSIIIESHKLRELIPRSYHQGSESQAKVNQIGQVLGVRTLDPCQGDPSTFKVNRLKKGFEFFISFRKNL